MKYKYGQKQKIIAGLGLLLLSVLAIFYYMVSSLQVYWLESPSSQPQVQNVVIDDKPITQIVAPITELPQLISYYLKKVPVTLAATNINIPSSRKANNVVNLYTPSLAEVLRARGLKFGSPMLIRIFKVPSILEVWIKKENKFVFFKSYNICRFSGRLGPKVKTGDRQSPEGFYAVYPHQLNPNSSYFLSFNLGYPNEYDKSHNRTGSALMVHGECASVGCYAMSNARISEIYTLMYGAFAAGQTSIQVQAYPFALTNNNMQKMKNHKWYYFWANLKVGYDTFERTHEELSVSVINGRYQVTPVKQ